MNQYLKMYIPLVDAIAQTFGKNCQAVLYDLTRPDHAIIKITNGNLTRRNVDTATTDFVLSCLRKNNSKKDYIIGYPIKTKKGAELKSTILFIRNNKNTIVGVLSINIDITPFISAKSVLEEMCTMPYRGDGKEENAFREKYVSNTKNLINELLEQSIKKVGKPVIHMDKKDKLGIIIDLKEKGFFLIKHSANRVSKELNVSLPTIYKYLEEVKDIRVYDFY